MKMKAALRHQSARPLLMLAGFGGLMAGAIAWQQPHDDFSIHPPKVMRAWIQQAVKGTTGGNARLFVRFQPDQRLANSVTIHVPNADGKDTTVPLHDDGVAPDTKAGDGIFTAGLDIDPNDLVTLNRAISQTMDKQPKIPIFSARQTVGLRQQHLINVNAFTQGIAAPLFPFTPTIAVDPAKSLMITNLGVVEDPTRTFNPCTNVGTPNGKWTFGHLMIEMANQSLTGVTPSNFIRQWLNNWILTQAVNGDVVAARAMIQNVIITPWEMKSGVGPGGALNPKFAPFKLLAIVNRIDLKANTVYGGGNAGEGRFVFCAIDSACNPLPFTVIFEYGIPLSGCAAVQNWGQQWVNLGSLTLGSPTYNAALEAITEQFAKANANPSKPNGSALNQLRTDEIELDFGAGWELREFHLSNVTNLLTEATVKQTPAFSKNFSNDLATYINANAPAVVAETNVVPLTFPGATPFLGGVSQNPFTFWNGSGTPPITVANARFHFSVNTCSGCHAAETSTGFTHVSPASFGTQAALSGFLTGESVTDPVDGVTVRTFNDLARRQGVLSSIVTTPCPLFPFFEMFLPAPPSVE